MSFFVLDLKKKYIYILKKKLEKNATASSQNSVLNTEINISGKTRHSKTTMMSDPSVWVGKGDLKNFMEFSLWISARTSKLAKWLILSTLESWFGC